MSKGLPRSLETLYGRVQDLEDGGIGAITDGSLAKAKLDASVQASLDLADSALQPGDEMVLAETEAPPVNAVAADCDLVISNVATHGETVDIDSDTYQFAADEAQTVDAGNIPVDIRTYTTKSTGTLTVASQPIAGDEFILGDVTYTFVGSTPADGEIDIGGSLAEAQTNIVAAINGTDSVNTPNPYARAGAFAVNASTITALIGGTAGDAIATTSTFDSESNSFGLTVLESGADCTAENAGIALEAAQDTDSVTLTESSGTVTATANVKGTAGNSIAVSTDMANAAWDTEMLEGGIDGTVGTIFIDDTYLYVAIGGNTVSDANWKRIAHTALSVT